MAHPEVKTIVTKSPTTLALTTNPTSLALTNNNQKDDESLKDVETI